VKSNRIKPLVFRALFFPNSFPAMKLLMHVIVKYEIADGHLRLCNAPNSQPQQLPNKPVDTKQFVTLTSKLSFVHKNLQT